MKKHLYTCFLALLCLLGSDTFAQVADSPGADSLHRFSGPHRGGETRSGVFTPRPGFVDTTYSAKQEGFWYIEVPAEFGSDSLSLRFWDHLVSERMNVTPGQPLRVSGREGNIYEGSRGFEVFEISFPKVANHGYFSVGIGRYRPAHQWVYFPQDRVRMRLDLSSGAVLFGASDGAFYRLQYEVGRAIREEQFNTDPVIFSPDREFYRSDSLSAQLWTLSRNRPGDLYVRMQLIGDAEEAWREVLDYISDHGEGHPAFSILDRYRDSLPASRLALVESAIKGHLLATGMNKAKLAWSEIREDTSKLAALTGWVDGFQLDRQRHSHPLLAQAYYQYALMVSHATQVPIEEVYALLPNPLREEVLAFYILDNFNRMEDRLPEVISRNVSLVESDWIKRRLERLLSNVSRPFSADGVYLPDGSLLNSSMLQGKTVLIHFWISGCRFCIEEHRRVMADLSERYHGSEDVLVMTINADANRESWKQSLVMGKYASESSLNAWVPRGTGILESYSIYSYPQKMIISKEGAVRLQSILQMDPADLIRRLEQDAVPEVALMSRPNL